MDNQFNQPGMGYPPQQPMGQMPTGQMPPMPMGQMPVNPMQQSGQLPPEYAQALQGQTGMQPPVNYPGTGQMPQGYPVQDPNQMGAPGYAPNQMPQSEQVPVQNQAPQGTAQQPVYPSYQQQPYGEPGYEHAFNYEQQGMAEQPPSGFPPQERKPMKRRLRLSFVHIVIIVVALVGAGVYLYTQLKPEAAPFGTIALGSLSATHAGDCLIVRNEAPYDAEGVTSITYVAAEGASVIRKDPICKVYSSGYSTREMRTLQEYRSEIRDYQKNLIESETAYDARMNRVTSDVLTRAKEVRDLIGGARGSLSNQETLLEMAVDARQQYLKEKYAADQRYTRLYDDEMAQTQRIVSWTKTEVANSEGIVSFYSDGYEYGLNSLNYTTFDPAQVRAMMNGKKPELTTTQKGRTTIYRMVKDGEWYVLFLSRDTSWNPVNGQVYLLQLERFENTLVNAEVVNFTRSGGELLVRLRVVGDVRPVLYMRTCDALLAENMVTLMADERAIYVQDGMTGVVIVSGETQSFIPVNVIRYEDGNVYFQAIQQGLLYEGQTIRLF